MTSRAFHSAVRELRWRAGFSQSELAKRAGISRQGVIAIEAGQRVPSTAVALRLAEVLSCSVEQLFSLGSRTGLTALAEAGEERPSGRVHLGRIDGRWIAHRVSHERESADGLVVGAEGDNTVVVEPLLSPEQLEANVLVAGCAPLLAVATRGSERRYGIGTATWIEASSGRALDLLDEGRVHIAGLHLAGTESAGGHGPLLTTRFPDEELVVLNLTLWRQGLVVPRGNPLDLRTAKDALQAGLRFAQRQPGSGARRLVERLTGGQAPPPGSEPIIARGHNEVARMVEWGVVDSGVAIEASALAAGLDFVPLAEERFDLVVPTRHLELPSVRRFLDGLSESSFKAEASRLAGYDLSMLGHVDTLTPSGETGEVVR